MTKNAPYKGLGADSEEKHEPASDINTAVVDSLKVLDPERPIREATVRSDVQHFAFGPCVTSIAGPNGMRNCTRDEGRPFEVGSQVLISSYRKLLLPKAMVVSVAETPGQESGKHG